MAETFAFLSFCAFLNLIIILIKENKKKLTLCQRNEQTLQIESTSHRPLCKWQRQSGNSMRAKERDDGRFFLSLSTRIALERDSLTLRIIIARADRFQAGLSTLSVISLWSYMDI